MSLSRSYWGLLFVADIGHAKKRRRSRLRLKEPKENITYLHNWVHFQCIQRDKYKHTILRYLCRSHSRSKVGFFYIRSCLENHKLSLHFIVLLPCIKKGVWHAQILRIVFSDACRIIDVANKRRIDTWKLAVWKAHLLYLNMIVCFSFILPYRYNYEN